MTLWDRIYPGRRHFRRQIGCACPGLFPDESGPTGSVFPVDFVDLMMVAIQMQVVDQPGFAQEHSRQDHQVVV